jgi:NAD(P)-dependent dehydrogenase (short-subunit alcohol dehydrogenase family)
MEKIILITGGSEGIGASIARLASLSGYIVCINYLQNHESARETVEAINQSGGRAYAFQADISKESEVERLFDDIDRQVGRLDALVNNAAIIEPQQKLVDMTAARLQKVFTTNVIGSFLCAREAIKRMSTQHGGKGGSIVNISSMASKHGSPFEYIDYAATKGAIDTMTVGLAREIVGEDIRVNAVRPGIIQTEIHRKAGEPNRIERVKERIPMKRAGQPEEVAHAVLWLLSEEASYVTGAIFDVSGGS